MTIKMKISGVDSRRLVALRMKFDHLEGSKCVRYARKMPIRTDKRKADKKIDTE